MPTFSSALLPTTNGLTFGSAALRWTTYIQDMDVAGTPTFTGRVAIKNLEDVRFADQYTGTVTQQLDAALADVPNGIVIAPSSMGAGSPTLVAAGQTLIDFRGGLPIVYAGVFSTNPIQFTRFGMKAPAFISSSGAASSGFVRLAYGDVVVSRDFNNSKDLSLLQADSTDAAAISALGRGAIVSGALAISGALSGCTTGAFSGQLTSSLATGTAPFAITSTTVVPNLNVATLNGVTVSGAPTTGQSLVATGTTTAAWSGSSGVYKMESMQYTPTTFVSSAGGALFTYSLPANELALNQALRITSTGTWTNTSVAVRTYVFTLKAGATTLYTWTLTASSGSVTNLPWGMTFLAICTASGSSGTLEVQLVDQQRYTGMTDPTTFSPTANTATIAFDTTTIQSLTLNVVQTNDATTATTGRQFMVERLG